MKNAFALLLLMLCGLGLAAQSTFKIPNLPMKVADDYAKHEPYIVEAAKWLESTPIGREAQKRKEVNAYVLMWLTGTPTVSLTMGEKLMSYMEKNPDLLCVYMASYSRNVIENPDTYTESTATEAGLKSMIKVYENSSSEVKKDKLMEKLVASKANLDKFVQEIVAEGQK